MKKSSYILLAMMLIIAVFVSCKAEVIDDSDFLVNVMFSSENNSKGLTWSRDFSPENYYWSYDASKADNGPRTGTATKAKVGGENGRGLKHDVGPFSVGTWNFTLYGYTNAERTELVYEGHSQAFLEKGSSNPVKVNVSSKDEQAGTILVSKDIRLTDGTNESYVPTHFSIKNAKDASPAMDTNNSSLQNLDFSTTEDMSYTVKSGSYVVTIEMRNEDDSVVYSSTQIYINVYDYQTTRIGGSLDDVKVSTKFEADDGTITGTSGVQAISATGSTTLTVKNVTPINSGDTTVEFPQGSLGSNVKKATLEVVAYPTYAIPEKFGISGNNSPLAGIDLSVFVGGNEVTEFESAVTVTTFVTKNLTSKEITSETAIADREGFNLFYNESDAEDKQPTLVSYNPDNGKLIFKTNHFSLYYVTSTSAVAINETTGVAYKSLKAAVDDIKDNETAEIVLLRNVDDGDGIHISGRGKAITLDFNSKTYNIAGVFAYTSNPSLNQAFRFESDNTIILKNGTITTTSYKTEVLIQSYCRLTLDDIVIDGRKNWNDSSYWMKHILSVGHGEILVTGGTQLLGITPIEGKEDWKDWYVKNAVYISYDSSNDYDDGVSVLFNDAFSGIVEGKIMLDSPDKKFSDGVYNHSLCINAGTFEKAVVNLSRVGLYSQFRMKSSITVSFETMYKVEENKDGYFVMTAPAVLNKTTGVIYEELGRAINDSSNGQVLVLRKNFDMESSIANPFNTKSVTIDLNGKTLGVKDSISPKIITLSSGCLTIEDGVGNGLLNKPIDSFFEFGGGKLVINGGTFVSDPTAYVVSSTHDVTPDSNEKPSTWTVSAK